MASSGKTKHSAHPIAVLRRSLGLTQPEMAAALGCTKTSLAGWEAGRIIPSGTTLKLLGILRDHPELIHTAPLCLTP